MINHSKKSEYRLSDNDCDVWLCRLSEFFNREDIFFEMLSDEEKSRAERFKFDIHRSRFIASHGFTRCVLGLYLSINARELTYKKGKQGKPYISNSNNSNIQFNLSHTEDIAILALTQGVDTGIDIECNKRKTDWQGIVSRFFTASEQQALFLLPEEQQRDAFFQLWTRKEAYMKVLGTGLSLAPTEFSLTVPPKKPALVKHYSTKYPALQYLSFNTLIMPQQYKHYCATLAMAAKSCHYNLYVFSEKCYIGES